MELHTEKLQAYKDIHELGQILGFKIPIDGFMTALTGRPVIDILALDAILVKSYDYEHVGSMSDFVGLGWGQRAHDLIDQNI